MQEFWHTYKWPVMGGIFGLIVAILFLTVGFFKTILVFLLVLAGGWLGMYLSKSQWFNQLIHNSKKS